MFDQEKKTVIIFKIQVKAKKQFCEIKFSHGGGERARPYTASANYIAIQNLRIN